MHARVNCHDTDTDMSTSVTAEAHSSAFGQMHALYSSNDTQRRVALTSKLPSIARKALVSFPMISFHLLVLVMPRDKIGDRWHYLLLKVGSVTGEMTRREHDCHVPPDLGFSGRRGALGSWSRSVSLTPVCRCLT